MEKHELLRRAERLREKAGELRSKAERASSLTKEQWLRLAATYEGLANEAVQIARFLR